MACASGTVRIPAQDPTPPLVALDVVGKDRTWVLTEGGETGNVELVAQDSLVLIALGEDTDGGVKDIFLMGNAVVTCKEARTGRLKSRTAAFSRRKIGSLLANPRAPEKKSARYILRASDFQDLCPNRGLTAVVGQATARTVNFHGGSSASPRLEFRLSIAQPADTSALKRSTSPEARADRHVGPAVPHPALGPALQPAGSAIPARRST